MSTYKTCISYVIQKGGQHIHAFEIAGLALPEYSFYPDNNSQDVGKWAKEKQKTFNPNEKIIMLHFFHVSNIK